MTSFDDRIRAMRYAIERAGLTFTEDRESVSVAIPHTLADKERFEAYLLDSLLTGFRAAKRGDWVLAFRCLMQSHYENGRLGGCACGPSVQDAISALQRWTEDTAVFPWKADSR